MEGKVWRIDVDSFLEKYSASHDHIVESKPGEDKSGFVTRFAEELWRLAWKEAYVKEVEDETTNE